MNLYAATIPQFKRVLQNVERWIDKSVAYAETKKFDPNTLLTARLAPDQFALVRQIQSTADQCKLTCARLTGKEAPSHPDTEKTWDELKVRMRAVKEFISAMKPADFDGAEARVITLGFLPGKAIKGQEYALEFALPNFMFHYTTVYQLLRHNGVDLGKMDFVGPVPFYDV